MLGPQVLPLPAREDATTEGRYQAQELHGEHAREGKDFGRLLSVSSFAIFSRRSDEPPALPSVSNQARVHVDCFDNLGAQDSTGHHVHS